MEIDVSPDYESMSRRATERLKAAVSETLNEQGLFALALAGGGTPRRLYERLAGVDLPWRQIQLFWGDERFVPHDHPKSNARLVQETLLENVEVPGANVHRIPTEGTPEAAAAAYEETLRATFADRSHTFDLVLLGMGTDGHTASLFPDNDPEPTDPKWVRAVTAPPSYDISQRVTCTLSVLNEAKQAFVLVSGSSKRPAVQAALDDKDMHLPVARVQPRERLVWLLDEAARPTPSTTS